MFERLNSFLKILSTLTHKAGAYIFLPALAIIITLDVILRYILEAPLVWSHEVNGLFLLFVFLGSLSHCWYQGRHIRMVMIFSRFSDPVKKAANIAAILTGILFFGALGFQSFLEIPFMIEINESGELFAVPYWPFKAFIGICCLIFVLSILLDLGGLLFNKNTDRSR